MKTGSESIVAIIHRRRILLVGFVARVEDTRLPNKCLMFGQLVGGEGCVGGGGGGGGRVDEVSPG